MIRHLCALVAVVAVGATARAQAGQQRRPPTPPVPVVPRIDKDAVKLEAELRRLSLEESRLSRELSRLDTDRLRALALDASASALAAQEAMSHLSGQFRLLDGVPRQTIGCSNVPGPRFPSDAADSLYLQARNLINAGDYRAAIIRLGELQQKHPNSRCIAAGMYYHAFALYRLGGDADLREALTILDSHRARYPNFTMASEVTTLATRVRGQLAQRGDANARALLRTADGSTRACDEEEQAVRSEALRGLMRIDPEAAMPKLRAILEQQDACIDLRRSALQILGSRRDEGSINALIATARNDSSAALRADAVTYVAQYGTDASAAALEGIARSDRSEQVRRAAARGLVGHASARARAAARALIADTVLSDNIKTEMLSRYTAERGTAEDAAWLRSVFPRMTSARVKQAIVAAVGRVGGASDQQWLMDLSTNDQEPTQVRQEAMRYVSRTMTVAQLVSAYDKAGSTATREQLLRALDSRPEPAAADKMLEVVRRGTDPRLRGLAIELLTRKKDPRLTAALLELIDR